MIAGEAGFQKKKAVNRDSAGTTTAFPQVGGTSSSAEALRVPLEGFSLLGSSARVLCMVRELGVLFLSFHVSMAYHYLYSARLLPCSSGRALGRG